MVILCSVQTTLLVKEKFLKTTARMGFSFSKSSFTLLALERLQEFELSYGLYLDWGNMVVVSLMCLLTFLRH